MNCSVDCKKNKLDDIISPDGLHRFVFYFKDCGAIANGPMQTSLLNASDVELPDEGNLLKNSLGIFFKEWRSNDTLVMRLNTSEPKTKFAASNVNGVTIIYEGITYTSHSTFNFSSFEIINGNILFKPSLKQILEFGFKDLQIPIRNLKAIVQENKVDTIITVKNYTTIQKVNIYEDIYTECKVIQDIKLIPSGLSNDESAELGKYLVKD